MREHWQCTQNLKLEALRLEVQYLSAGKKLDECALKVSYILYYTSGEREKPCGKVDGLQRSYLQRPRLTTLTSNVD